MLLKIAPAILLLVVVFSPALAWSGWFGPSNYDECIQEHLKGVQSSVATRAIISICKRKFSDSKEQPEDECILENLKDAQNDLAARALIKVCREKFNKSNIATYSTQDRNQLDLIIERRLEELKKQKNYSGQTNIIMPNEAQKQGVGINASQPGGVFGVPELLVLIFIAIASLPAIFYCLTLRKALLRCSPENRKMNPRLLWLFVVPIVNIIWNFIICIKVDTSLKQEYEARKMPERFKSTRAVGMAYCILAVFSFIPTIGVLSGIAAAICWIVFWVKVAGLSRGLAPMPASQ